MKLKTLRMVAMLLAFLLLLQPLLGGLGTAGRAAAASTPLEQINNADDEESLMLALTNPDANLNLPSGFTEWSAADKSDALKAIKTFIKPNDVDSNYETLEQVQYVLDLIDVTYASRDDLSLATVSSKIDKILGLSSKLSTLFPNSSQAEQFQSTVDSLNALNSADKSFFNYLVKLQFAITTVTQESSPFTLAQVILMVGGQLPTINRAETPEDMGSVMDLLINGVPEMIEGIKNADSSIPIENLGLDFSKAEALDEEEGMELVQWMFDRRPQDGYADIAAIQTAFDNFFKMIPLRDVNAAIKDKNVKNLLTALTNPALGLTLPEGFESWSNDIKMSWAATFTNIFGEDGQGQNVSFSYGSVDQLQYVSDLAAIPVGLLEDQSLTSIGKTIDAAFAKIADFEKAFPDIEQSELFAKLGDDYNALTPVEKYIYKYYLYITITTAVNEPPSDDGDDDDDSDNGNGIGTGNLFYFLLYPYAIYQPVAINHAVEPQQMLGSLGFLFQFVQMTAESFEAEHPGVDYVKWGLDLSKLQNISPKDESIAAELSNWMLDKRPEGGYADLAAIQTTFDQFFTPAAPSVTADDVADKLVGATAAMEYSTDNGTTWTSYDPENAPVFSNYVTVLVRYKENGVRSASPTTSVSFNVPYSPPSNTNTETIYVDVQGSNGSGLARTPVTRTTDASGKMTDTVTLTSDIAKEAVDKAKAQSGTTVRIVLPDSGDKVSEVRVNVPLAALTQLNDGKMNLELSTSDGVITVPVASLSGFGQDLYFRLVPVKTENGRVQIETRAKQETAIQQYLQNEAVKIYGRPMEIETNLQSKEATLFMPLKDGLPTDATARNRILNHLGVYAEHSDGTKELIQGKVVTVNNVTGIQFTVQKFSTFALVYLAGLNDAAVSSTHTPYINGFGTQFRPEAFVTRAQMAAMLARNLPDTTVTTGTTAGSDVRSGHWAINEILKAKAAGIMGGITEDMFDPEGAVTRAQMAAIAARWLQKGPTGAQVTPVPGSTAGYSDVSVGHWAADAISYVSARGIMTGYAGQTFKPDQKLTRAEAVKVLNRLFDRGPLNGATAITFTDVPATHWAYADIEEAATNHTFTVDAQGIEHIAAP
ncbi:DUF4073 domain-containing protein [Cohnella sp. GCM10020058]|uniref:DUF4073 domain-containing protein n=1 Tax=Cohnella sp. GCM10020058 TaxID=3317330 RepID=UPI00363CC580